MDRPSGENAAVLTQISQHLVGHSNQFDGVEIAIELFARAVCQENALRSPVAGRANGLHQLMIFEISQPPSDCRARELYPGGKCCNRRSIREVQVKCEHDFPRWLAEDRMWKQFAPAQSMAPHARCQIDNPGPSLKRCAASKPCHENGFAIDAEQLLQKDSRSRELALGKLDL